ncbi:recombinase family protein [Vibrio harveyi]|uniref:recombinase family protein n=1 Tax=Vibrio harveyi TaxID=669 RepID=UPI00390A424D
MNQKKYLFLYRRVSSHKQLHGGGLSDQTLTQEDIDRLCTEYGLELYPEAFEDKAQSAYHLDPTQRPAFTELLSVLDNPSVSPESVVCMGNIDRLTRTNLNKAAHILTGLAMKCRLYMVHERRMYDQTNPNLMVDLLMCIVGLERSHNESLTKSMRTNQAIQSAIDAHIAGTKGPNGLAIALTAGRLPKWCYKDKITKEVRTNESNAKLIAEVCERLVQGQSVYSVHRWVEARFDGVISQDYIRRIHQQESLIGKYKFSHGGTTVVLEDYVPTIISEDLYYQLRAIRTLKHSNQRQDREPSLLTGFNASKCRSCGSFITTHRMPANKFSDKPRERLKCSCMLKQGKCTNPVIVETKELYPWLNQNILLECRFAEVEEPSTDTSIHALERKLHEATSAFEKIKNDYATNPQSFLVPIMADKQSEILKIQQEIDDSKTNQSFKYYEPVLQLPTDPVELRLLYIRTFRSVKYFRVSKGLTLISFYTRYPFTISILLYRGRIVRVGKLTDSFANDNLLEDDQAFMTWFQSTDSIPWRTKP